MTYKIKKKKNLSDREMKKYLKILDDGAKRRGKGFELSRDTDGSIKYAKINYEFGGRIPMGYNTKELNTNEKFAYIKLHERK